MLSVSIQLATFSNIWGLCVCVPCVSEIMRKFPSLFWEYTLDKLLLKQL